MASFLSTGQQTAIISLFDTLHETFAKPIIAYQNGQTTVINTSPQYNRVYGRKNTGSEPEIEYTTVSGEYLARVYYLKMQEEVLANSNAFEGSPSKIIFPIGSVKIVVPAAAYDFMKDSRRVELDGKIFSVKSGGNPLGFVSNQFFTFFLTPLEE